MKMKKSFTLLLQDIRIIRELEGQIIVIKDKNDVNIQS